MYAVSRRHMLTYVAKTWPPFFLSFLVGASKLSSSCLPIPYSLSMIHLVAMQTEQPPSYLTYLILEDAELNENVYTSPLRLLASMTRFDLDSKYVPIPVPPLPNAAPLCTFLRTEPYRSVVIYRKRSGAVVLKVGTIRSLVVFARSRTRSALQWFSFLPVWNNRVPVPSRIPATVLFLLRLTLTTTSNMKLNQKSTLIRARY